MTKTDTNNQLASSRLFIDVTQLIHLDGHVTGIPRVMEELAIRFHRDNPEAIFVSWVKEVGAYCLIDYEASVERRGSGIKYITNDEQADGGKGSKRNISDGTADTAKPFVKRAMRFGVHQTRKVNPKMADYVIRRFAEKKALSYKQVSFRPNDTVFIGWGEWWDSNFLSMLEAAHSEDGLRITTIIHDVGPMVTPHLSGHSSESLAEYCRRIVPICDTVFVNSQHTGKELKSWIKSEKLAAPPIAVFTLGDDFTFASPAKPKDEAYVKSRLSGGDYIMTVGTVELKKNHIFLYYVYYLARQRGVELPKIVIVGRKGWNTDINIELMTQDPVLGDKFVFLFNTSDNELAWLYDHCLFTVFPSFYEGWGIPIAESLFHGVPSISANVTSMMEIGDGIVGRFSPASTDECLAEITKLLDADNLGKAKRLVSNYKPVTWDDTYEQIIVRLKEDKLV